MGALEMMGQHAADGAEGVPAFRELPCAAGCGLLVLVYADQPARPCEFCASGARLPVTKSARRALAEKRAASLDERATAVLQRTSSRAGEGLGRCPKCRQPWVNDPNLGIVHAPGGCRSDAITRRVPADDILNRGSYA